MALARLAAPLLGLAALIACEAGSPDDGKQRAPAQGAAPPLPAPTRTAAPAPPPPGAAHGSPFEWNDGAIAWLPYRDAVARATTEKKPILVVLWATWCPHCKNYARVFADPKVVSAAKDFVMVRVDTDAEGDVAKRLSPDGEYVPRTVFLGTTGNVLSVRANEGRYKYFYNEHNPDNLIAGMTQARDLVRN